MADRRMLLVLDCALDRSIVAVRVGPDGAVIDGSATMPERGAAALGRRLAEVFQRAAASPWELAAIGVGIGPGSFTGLRVGLATAKTLAWASGIPLLGVSTVDALRRAAAPAGVDPASIAVVQAAGARDHYLTLPGEAPRLVPPGTDLVSDIRSRPAIALGTVPARLSGVAGPAGEDPCTAGDRARDGLVPALLALLGEGLADGRADDPAALAPAYVALPRGVAADAGAGWAPDLR